jgi:putative membrane protein
MKSLLRNSFLNLTTLYITAKIFSGFSIENTLSTLLTAAIVFTLLDRLVKPIIKILLLPINLITLGLFRWVISVITIFLLEALVKGITVKAFFFEGFTYQGFVVPSFTVSLLASYILTSIIIRAISSFLRWLTKS